MMTRQLKSSMTSSVSVLLSLLLSLQTSGCGLGTEVGNGAKPGNDESSKKNGSSENQPVVADAGNESDGGDDTDLGKSGDMGTGESEGSGSPALATAGYEFDINILLNNCASPFESQFDGKILLGSLTKSGKMSKIIGDYDEADSSWVLKDALGQITAKISDRDASDDHKVQVVDSKGLAIDSGYTCGDVTGSAEGDSYAYSALLTKDGKSARISWKVFAGDSQEKLESITITPDTGSSIVIKFSPLKN